MDRIAKSERLTLKQVARAAGVTQRTVRFYQSKGLLNAGGPGLHPFTAADLARMLLIQQGKRLGFTLGEIREMLGSLDAEAPARLRLGPQKCAEQIDLLEDQRAEIDAALAELRQIYAALFTPDDLDERLAQVC